ncbi:YchF/TatD family DNA exonuclease [Catenovulum sp. 2E275]|uniref:TatD family hydrolase n=1 Tax=Catenovulum sp. 2E275 TaxID=2980497 RepID=UPI0021CF88D7|nr:YchF/TatD family DNA exonuclease [Catenovulum sp. 2E275]MCU4674770.1 YchF/TatD family DNA exonuclease [Catenovulum sp. 2E275]
MLVDSHCHLDRLKLEELGGSLDVVIEKARAKKIEHFLCVCVTLNDFKAMAEVVDKYPDVSVSCGVHPLHKEDMFAQDELLKLAKQDKVVAIGETGLDYFYSEETKPWQKQAFRQHCQVAVELNKPLIIHTRDARKDTIDILTQESADKCGGVLHCFTESLDMAKAAMDLNFYVSISGIVTFGNATELREVVRALPLDRLLIETDSPWLAPKPYRGKQNQPAYVHEVAQFVADLKGVPLSTLAQATTENFYNLFKQIKLNQAG